VIIRNRFIGHVCFFDRTCWKHYFELGTPLSIYVGKRHWHMLKNHRRFERIWDLDHPVSIEHDEAGQLTRAVFRSRREG
jgi:hypothetical protein